MVNCVGSILLKPAHLTCPDEWQATKAGVLGLTLRITGNPSAAKTSSSMHALGRIGRPRDVARLIVWLLDPANDWVTGQVFGVDGGLATVRSRQT